MARSGEKMRILVCLATLFVSSLLEADLSPAPSNASAPDATELTSLLRQFLDAVPRNDPAVHDRFWADDLIYTRAAGVRIDKPELMREIKAETATSAAGSETTTYSAEDIRIQQYGTTAVVAFRLVGTMRKGDQTEITNYYNTGTFVKRDGKWQAVAWQATRIPAENELKK